MAVQTESEMKVAPRDPAQVMRLARLGSFHQSRLSFMRQLTRRMQSEHCAFSRPKFAMDDAGVGHAVYSAEIGGRTYSLVAFAHDLPDAQRSDRVIAEAWDATFTLFDGVPADDDIDRLSRNVPVQEAGRVTAHELTVSRANRSVRLWNHVVDALAAGQQPDADQIDAVGYLMRTTAVYGSGKLGAADREQIAGRPEFESPFQAEMLTVYLIRWFVRDLVQHMARAKGGAEAVTLDPLLARRLGIGNSTGLGMAPFLINHPVLTNNWIAARENAIARVRSLQRAETSELALFENLLARSAISVERWSTSHPLQAGGVKQLDRDLQRLRDRIVDKPLTGSDPWNTIYLWTEENLGLEAQECLASLMLEPYGALVDDLCGCMSADETAFERLRGDMKVSELAARIEEIYGWALETDWADHGEIARAWYVSAEKLEPRLGERFEEPIEPYEQPLAPARDIARLHGDLAGWAGDETVAAFVLRHPEHRHAVRRVQVVSRAPYAEIRDNTISAEVLPIDMLRCKLSFFGAVHFDPRSDRWVRICMFGNAPYPEELARGDADTWPYPDIAASPG
ncbi:MAG: hypothetical protein HKN02_00920 [Rhodobacteraceae bacterium]|nr:hypothetical protein [Paracoccaceae bacterium]